MEDRRRFKAGRQAPGAKTLSAPVSLRVPGAAITSAGLRARGEGGRTAPPPPRKKRSDLAGPIAPGPGRVCMDAGRKPRPPPPVAGCAVLEPGVVVTVGGSRVGGGRGRPVLILPGIKAAGGPGLAPGRRALTVTPSQAAAAEAEAGTIRMPRTRAAVGCPVAPGRAVTPPVTETVTVTVTDHQ